MEPTGAGADAVPTDRAARRLVYLAWAPWLVVANVVAYLLVRGALSPIGVIENLAPCALAVGLLFFGGIVALSLTGAARDRARLTSRGVDPNLSHARRVAVASVVASLVIAALAVAFLAVIIASLGHF